MKLKMKYLVMMLVALSALFFTACSNEGDSVEGKTDSIFKSKGKAGKSSDIIFQSVEQTGGTSGKADSSALILTFDGDPATLTADNIKVTGATKGVLSGSGTTRSLSISKITVANGATVSVEITNPSGYEITGSPQTVLVHRSLYIGMPYLGGVIAYIYQPGDSGYVKGRVGGIIAAAKDQSHGIMWAMEDYQTTALPGSTRTGLGSGRSNTDKIIAQNGRGSTYAAGLARACRNGGYSDWFLPSKDELNKLYVIRAAIGGFADANYWSSSMCDGSSAWDQFFYGGFQNTFSKNTISRVRAVRYF